uniref:Chemokine interleukin-8-like domain-containing protein n=1 Tax=Amphiprion ocellaris TaxID=80972 RepID=A0AAQ5XX34_AMPOC
TKLLLTFNIDGAKLSTAPGNCCFNFYTRPLPANRVSNVIKTHSSCLRPAFIVQTVRGRQICYSQTFQWALDQYQKINTPEVFYFNVSKSNGLSVIWGLV